MVVDIGVVRNYIKPKADSTLYNMRKTDLIEYIRCLEHNYNVAVSFNENQAKYIESLGIIKVVRCKDCIEVDGMEDGLYHCPYCTDLKKADDFCSYGERKDNA